MDKRVGISLASVGIGLLAVMCVTIGMNIRQKASMMSDRSSVAAAEQPLPDDGKDSSNCTDAPACKSEPESTSSENRAVPRPSAVAADGSTTVTATAVTVPPVAGASATADASATATVNVQVQVPLPKPPPPPEPEKPQAILPFRVCVMEFTTIDTQGKIRFIDPANKELDVAPRCTLNDADRTSVNDVMQGFVRLVDAVENHKTKDAKNAITRGDALGIWRTVVHGETRPAVIGAEYLESYLGRNGEVFACLDRPLMVAAMKKLQEDPEFPTDFQLKLAKATGATHLVYGTVGNVTSRENSFTGYGIATKTTNYSLDVIVKMVDLVTQQTVYSNTYTGNYREQRPISGVQFDNNIFQSLMKSALQQAADDLYDRCRPGRNNTIRVTPLPENSAAKD